MKPIHARKIGQHLVDIGIELQAAAAADEVVIAAPPPVIVVSEPPLSPQAPPIVTPTAVTWADVDYVRSIQTPMELHNAFGIMAGRVVNGEPRLIMLGYKNEARAYELDISGSLATIVNVIPDYHQGTMRLTDPVALADPTAIPQPYGACMDDRDDLLIITFADPYNTGQRADPSYCVYDLHTGGAHGPFTVPQHSHHGSGYGVVIPGIGLCFGAGLSSGNIGSSWGPCLHRPDGSPIIDFSFDARCRRNSDYIAHVYENTPDRVPDANGGFWTQMDFIRGCVHIDTGTKRGLLFVGLQGKGDIWYGGPGDMPGILDPVITKGPHAARRVPTGWLCDMDNLAAPPLEMDLRTITPPGSGFSWEGYVTGGWFNKATNKVYLATPDADYSGGRDFAPTPMIHEFQIR